MNDRPKFDLHAEITHRIARAVEEGAGEFAMPWHRGAATGTPVNAVTKRAYRGVNIVSLWIAGQAAGHPTNRWATFKQWRGRGAQVRKGEKGTLIVFYKMLERLVAEADDDDEEIRSGRLLMAKPSWVFNAAQVDGLEPEEASELPGTQFDRIEAAENAIRATGFDIRFGGSRAFYHRLEDFVQCPRAQDFIGSPTSTPRETFYSTLLHEMAHMTGSESRLNREKGKRFVDKPYAFEELVAELSAAYSCAELGIANEPRLDHAQYIASWLEILKHGKRAIFTAASGASAATDYILSFSRSPSDS